MKKEKISGWTLIFLMLTWLPASQAQADGGFFSSRSVAVSADQRAIIIKNGDEISMTFSTGYTGEGEDFGWIIPTPVPPAIEDVSEAGEKGETAFRILDEYSAPLFFEGKAPVQARESSKPLVTAYGQVILEHYEVSILGAADALALLDWLRKNGYQVDPASRKILENYVDQNWAFVAVKLNPGEKRNYENEFLPALTIKYRHEQLIFPLRISAVSTTSTVKITLYVIAESTVSSSNYTIADLKFNDNLHELVAPEIYIDVCIQETIESEGRGLVMMQAGRFGTNTEQQQIIHQLMNTPFNERQPRYLTRLEARMDPADMSEDIRFLLDPSPNGFWVDIRASSVHRTGSYGVTGLMYAAVNNRDPEMISERLKADADINTQDALGVTALMYAARFNRSFEAISMLLQAGADVNLRNMHGETALMYASGFQSPEAISMLLEAGADVNALDENGETALMDAARWNRNPEVISMLLEARADVNAHTSYYRNTALMDAARWNRNPEVISMLLKAGADVNARDSYHSETALMHAAEKNQNPEVISVLLEAGADVNARDENGETALMHAAEKNRNPEVISILLEAGVDVNDRTPGGITALMFAAEQNTNPEVISVLLEAGADVNARDTNGQTALMGAAGCYYPHRVSPEVIALLLEAGADVNAKGGFMGRTALMSAARRGHTEVVQILLQAGANVNDKNNDGKSAMMLAKEKGHTPIVNLLRKAGAKE